ncbi:integrase core domain-containing protein [Leisingera sp. M523]|nr:integrase core domain-containing protein [Leisingera sp. M523]
MDGRGRWIGNRTVERLRRSLKGECVCLNAFETGSEARAGISTRMACYNAERRHSTHGILPPG